MIPNVRYLFNHNICQWDLPDKEGPAIKVWSKKLMYLKEPLQ